ncbi:MAG TPA: hypothetical protein VF398_01095 [bacterium]|jgi:hypothetical protein
MKWNRWLLAASAILLGILPVQALENFHGYLRLFGSQQETDQPTSRSLNQQYSLNYSRSILPAIQTFFALNYQDQQSHQDPENDSWHGELMPLGNLTWNTPFFNFGGNYRYRQVRDLNAANRALSRGAGLVFKTKFVNLPQSQISYNWDRNSSNAGFLASEVEQRLFQYQASYYYKTAGINYNYNQINSENLSFGTGLDQSNHILRLDFAQSFFQDRRLRFSGDYLFNSSRNQQTGAGTAPLASQIPALQGLYAFDLTPEVGSLDIAVSGLIDGNLTEPTTPPINIGGSSAGQNIGFDLGSSRQINLIYVYVDTASEDNLEWTVHTSGDNSVWSALPGAVSLYNSPFRRYEMSFSPTAARYFKVVNSGVNENPEVLVTEIQAFLTSPAGQNQPLKSQNHRISLNGNYQVHRHVQLGMDATFGSLTENLSGQDRQETSIAANASFRPSSLFSANARVQHSAVDYAGDVVPLQESNVFSLTFLSNPQPTLELSLSGSRYETKENHRLSQISNSSLLHASFLLIPGLSGTAEAGYSRNEQVIADYITDTYTYRLSADANPYRSLYLNASYSVQDYESDLAGASGRRDNLNGRFNYRLTWSISLQGGISYARDQGYESVDQDYSLSWILTDRLSASANAHLQDADGTEQTRQYGAQSSYRLSNRTDVFASYSFSDFGETQNGEIVTFQMGLNTGF